MKKRHIGLITLLLIAQILIIAALVYVGQNMVLLRLELNSTRVALQKNITEGKQEMQAQINELTETLALAQEDLTGQINELKATTSADFSGIIEEALKSIVSIRTNAGSGSGFFVAPDGYVVTNAHVLYDAYFAEVTTYEGEKRNSELIGYNTELDIAILKVDGIYDYLEFADSDEVKIGEKVIAVGNPMGLSFSVTEGIVSAVNREGLNELPIYIQTDVPLNPGNSGGPLINSQGEVVGINNFKIGSSEGLGFALQANEAVDTIELIDSTII